MQDPAPNAPAEPETAWPAADTGATGPLRGVKVLDLTTVIMGPSATQILGDLGADVLKIESPAGDSVRWVGPWRNPGMGPLFLSANRNKRSLMLDLKAPEGRRIALALAGQADVIVSNVRPQAMARLGLDYASVAAANSGVIYCAAVGYGAGGPLAGQPVYDDLMQAASGLSGLFGRVEGAPRYAPVNLCDRIVGLYAVNAVTAALYHRAMTGQGQEIEVPMFETMAQFVLADHLGGAAFVPPAGPMGYNRLLSRTRGPYATQDGYLAVMLYTNKHWHAFASLIGKPGLLAADPRFTDQDARTRNAEAVGSFLAEELALRGTESWIAAFNAADIPACKVNSIEDLLTHEHLAAVDFFETSEHPSEGRVLNTRHPVRYAKTPARTRRLAPGLGEYNSERAP